MALRDNPYLPLYVQDFLTDEKLAECSAEATGVYIRLMCLMHKSDEYGKITLREKDICRGKNDGKQPGKYGGTIQIFAEKLTKHLPYSVDVIKAGLAELLDEGVLYIDGFSLCQKRMIRDSDLSEKRAVSGRRGAITTNNNNNKHTNSDDNFAAAKLAANTENENECDNNIINIKEKEGAGGKGKVFSKPNLEEVRAYCQERNNSVNPESWLDFYTSNGWRVGKNPMRDWKAAVRTWERNGINNGNNGRQTNKPNGISGSPSKGGFTGTF